MKKDALNAEKAKEFFHNYKTKEAIKDKKVEEATKLNWLIGCSKSITKMSYVLIMSKNNKKKKDLLNTLKTWLP